MPLTFEPHWAQPALLQRYGAVTRAFQHAQTYSELQSSIETWEQLRRDVAGWKGVLDVRMRQNVDDNQAREQSEMFSSAAPLFEDADCEIKRLILQSPHRAELESDTGRFLTSRWALDLQASDPLTRPYLEEQSRLCDRYTRVLATMQFSLHGRPCSRSELATLQQHPDNAVRRDAAFAKWAPFATHADELDEIFDALVHCRASMAAAIGEATFTTLAYRRLGRLDYTVSDVGILREEIRETALRREKPRARSASNYHTWACRTFLPMPPAHRRMQSRLRTRSATHFNFINLSTTEHST